MPANVETSTVATGMEKISFHSKSQRREMPKNAPTTTQLHSTHHYKVILKILQARLQQYVYRELPDVQAGLRKGKGTRDQIANICSIIEKARVPEKHLLLLH